jgi:hypothetical protein
VFSCPDTVKWLCLILQAVCALVATAMAHSDNRLVSAVTLAMFATGVAASILLIASHDRPFTGDISVGPDPLVQVMPAEEAELGRERGHAPRDSLRDCGEREAGCV